MKHIDIQPLINAVKGIELQEARKALEAYGGSCTFNPELPPSVEYYGGAGPASASVRRISFGPEGPEGKDIVIEVLDDTDGGTFEISPSDLYPGSLLAIVDFM